MRENTANVLHSSALTSTSGYCSRELKRIRNWSISLLSERINSVLLSFLCLIFTIIPFHLRFQISLLQYEKFINTTQDFPRVQLSILLLYVQIMESLVLDIKDHLRGIPLIIIQRKLITAKFLNRKSRHSFLKLTSKIRVSQNNKRHYQTLVFASRWLIS